MLAKHGMVLVDSAHRVADSAGHSDPGPLRRRCGSAIATAQADRLRQLANEEVALGVGLRSPLDVSECTRLVDVIVDLREAPTVRTLGPCIEDLTRISE